jgi:hypothetical protein
MQGLCWAPIPTISRSAAVEQFSGSGSWKKNTPAESFMVVFSAVGEREAGGTTQCRVVRWTNPLTFRDHFILEYEVPKYDGDMGQPGFTVPFEKQIYQQKVHYLMDVFESQRHKRWFEPETFLSLMRLRGMECNAPSGYATAGNSPRKVATGQPSLIPA